MKKHLIGIFFAVLVSTGMLSGADQATVDMHSPLSIEGVGAGQGAEWKDGLFYFYGDRGIGVMREYRVVEGNALEYTGNEFEFTVKGTDTVSHPTGLTWNQDFGTYMGDTVSGKGTILKISWENLVSGKNLDDAILNVTMDDLAVNGTRPEFVKIRGRDMIATADYGEVDNAIRLYDPEALSTAVKTSEPGVLIKSIPCTPWVQTIHWMEEKGLLVLIQNQIEGLLWRLSLVDLEASFDSGEAVIVQVLDFKPKDELEGFHFVNPELGIFVSSSRKNNVIFGNFIWR